MNCLFTYGTLKPGNEANHFLNSINGTWFDGYVLGNWITDSEIKYPIIELNEKGDKIFGKLFFSNQLSQIIDSLDDYEGEEYQRVVTNVYLNDGIQKQAFVYEKAK